MRLPQVMLERPGLEETSVVRVRPGPQVVEARPDLVLRRARAVTLVVQAQPEWQAVPVAREPAQRQPGEGPRQQVA